MNRIIAILLGLSLLGFSMPVQAQVITGTITGNKFNDIDGDGIRDIGEPGISGVTIYVDADADATLDSGEVSSITDANGNFTLTGVATGTVAVREVSQAGWTQTFPPASANMENIVVVGAGLTSGPISFANRITAAATTGSISGTKFNDLDADGLWDSGEPGLSGVTMYLDANSNNSFDSGEVSTVTDATGSFAFTGLGSGTVTVREVIQAGWTQTAPGASAGFESPVTVSIGGNIPNINFGNRVTLAATATISGVKYEDMDLDGVRDPGEPGVVGITVYIDANNNGMLDSGELSTMTTAGGNYSFPGLAAGSYTIREAVTVNWAQLSPGSSSNMSHTVTVGPGDIRANLDFGNRLIANGTGIGGPGSVLGDAVGGDDTLPVTGSTAAALLAIILTGMAVRMWMLRKEMDHK